MAVSAVPGTQGRDHVNTSNAASQISLRYRGTVYTIPFDPTDTVDKIKQVASVFIGIVSEKSLMITFQGQLLKEGDRTAADYGIRTGVLLDIVSENLRGGAMLPVSFVRADKPLAVPVEDWDPKKHPEWVKIRPGFNLRGRCTGVGGSCSGQITWLPLGFSQEAPFSMSKVCAVAKCICCESRLEETINVALFHCKAKITGQYKDDKGVPVSFTKEWTSSEKKEMLTFDDTLEGSVQAWDYLEFTVSPLKKRCCVVS